MNILASVLKTMAFAAPWRKSYDTESKVPGTKSRPKSETRIKGM
jgi:hypothetical protein